VVKDFEGTRVIHGVDLQVKHGEFIVFVGPSGCGKSTLLRLIAGLEEVTAGDILDRRQARVNHLRASDRELAMVFQSYALYPHMTRATRTWPSRWSMRKDAQGRDRAPRVSARPWMLRLDRLSASASPSALSGGQRQRVAIGRAIVREPEDLPVRRAAVQPGRRAARRHPQGDLARCTEPGRHHDLRHPRPGRGDDAGRPHRGAARRPHRAGRRSPLELYNRPANRFVAGFIGSPQMNFVPTPTWAPTGACGRCSAARSRCRGWPVPAR
jgi:ABC-type sugar transport system ATPase subunit